LLDFASLWNGRVTGRVFGVELKARTTMDGIGRIIDGPRLRLRTELGRALKKTAQMMRDLPFPLLFMVFAMDTDRAFFAWVREPLTQRRLKSPEIECVNEWVSNTHTHVIGAIDKWYETPES
jgi:hypothetical protein